MNPWWLVLIIPLCFVAGLLYDELKAIWKGWDNL